MDSPQMNPNPSADEPELNLLLGSEALQEPLWKSLFRQLDEFFFPKKLPPLKLESKPEPVKDIWGFYNYRKDAAAGTTAVHIVIVGVIVALTLLGRHIVTPSKGRKQGDYAG